MPKEKENKLKPGDPGYVYSEKDIKERHKGKSFTKEPRKKPKKVADEDMTVEEAYDMKYGSKASKGSTSKEKEKKDSTAKEIVGEIARGSKAIAEIKKRTRLPKR